MDSVDFWDGLIRLIKYLSIAATAYFAWYGAAHETRDSKSRLTSAGKKVVLGVIVSLIFGLMSQFGEDKRETKKKAQEQEEKDSIQKVFDNQRKIDDAQQNKQIDRLDSLLTRSNYTLEKLKHQDSIQKNIMMSSSKALQTLNSQNILQQKLIHSSETTIANLANQSKQQSKLLLDQQKLLRQANSQIYPLAPISFFIGFKYSAINKDMLNYVINDAYFTKTGRINAMNQLFYIQQPTLWAIKIYKKINETDWEIHPGLVYVVNKSEILTSSVDYELNDKKTYLLQRVEIKNPERLIHKPAKFYLHNFSFWSLLKEGGIDQEIIYSKFAKDIIDTLGEPSIFSIIDLIDSKIEIETIVTSTNIDVHRVEIQFSGNFNNHSILLKGSRGLFSSLFPSLEHGNNNYWDDFSLNHEENINERAKQGPVKIIEFIATNDFLGNSKRYKLIYTSIITKEILGLNP